MVLLGGLRGNRNLELGGLAGDARVNLGERLSLSLGVVDLAIEVDDVGLGAARGDADALAGDFRGEDDVVEESLVDGGNGETARSVDERSLGALGLLVDDASLGNEDNIRAAEFLLELVDDLGLNLSELRSEALEGDNNEDGLLVLADLDFLSSGELESLENSLHISGCVGVVHDLDQSLSELSLEFRSALVVELADFGRDLHDDSRR